MEQAFACYENALEYDPSYPDPFAGIALCYIGGILGWISQRDAASKQKEAAQRALALSPSTPHAHYAFAHAVHCYDWDWSLAEQEYRRELDVNPTNAEAQSTLAVLFSNLGKHDEAIREAERAVEADPLSPFIGHHLAMVLTIAGRHDASITQARHDIEMSPTFYLTHWDLGMALWAQGKTEDALAAFRTSQSHAGRVPLIEGSLGWALGRAGHKDEARAVAGELEVRRESGHCSACSIASIYAGLGETDTACDWLDRAHEERDGQLIFIGQWPWFQHLRSAPRFQALLRKMNFPQPSSS